MECCSIRPGVPHRADPHCLELEHSLGHAYPEHPKDALLWTCLVNMQASPELQCPEGIPCWQHEVRHCHVKS